MALIIKMPPILSICIPTYNRAEYLKLTIKSIVKQEVFQKTNQIEIVISDNCSDDNTEQVVNSFYFLYPSKIKYFKNQTNIKDKNFEKVLSYGSGDYLKLSNDTLLFKNNSLLYMIDLIVQNKLDRDILFFSNTYIKNISTMVCDNLNQFVGVASYWSTWIACFGIWKDDFNKIDDFSRYSHLQFVQTDILFRLISKNKKVLIDNISLFDIQQLQNKGGYNVFYTFGVNYLSLYDEYLETGILSKKVYKKEKYKLFRYYLMGWYQILVLSKDNKYSFEKKNAVKYLMKNYRYNYYLYFFLIYMYFKYNTKRILKK